MVDSLSTTIIIEVYMESKSYTTERGCQILISLMKQNNIKKIITSPGATNVTFVGSVMNDPFFEVFSSVDERSAAYMAVGMAEETGEVIVLSCTGATASRNYIPGLTEAFYRKLPILAITATQNINRVGHLIPQVIDRSQSLKDICVLSEYIPVPHDGDTEWDVTIRCNRAILALRHRGGGPVHINLMSESERDFSVKELPVARCIKRYTLCDNELPQMPLGRVGIMVGSHLPWTENQVRAIDRFCNAYGAIVYCEHGSNYSGKYRVNLSIINQQQFYSREQYLTDVLIHIGEVTAYGNTKCEMTKQVWRVNEDGELRDPMRKLKNIFEMREEDFFNRYADMAQCTQDRSLQQANGAIWLKECRERSEEIRSLIPELPLSNIWIASQTAPRLPEDCYLHIAILNSLRAWNMFEVPLSVRSQGFAETGGFGIDGCMSAMIGGSMVFPNKLHFLVIGDLAFFYDLNSLGNRHIGANVRILLINNGKGTEFRNYNHPAARFGDEADRFMAAAGHFGNKSKSLVRHYAEDLGFEYMQASTKEEFLDQIDHFLTPSLTKCPMLLEVFTNSEDESNALKIVNTLKQDAKGKLKKVAMQILPQHIVDKAQKALK